MAENVKSDSDWYVPKGGEVAVKKHIRMITDIVMLVLFLYLMRYHPGMGLRLHALLGIALCALFVLHHFLNVKWYAVLFRGRYRFRRLLMTVSDFLLLLAMLAIMVSSLMISGLAFPVSFLPVAFYWRDIHVMSTAWGFALMAFHLGVHVHGFLSKLEKRMSKTIFGYVVYLPQVLVLGAGIYGFSNSGLWNDMWMTPQSLPPLPAPLFYGEYLGMVGALCVAVHFLIACRGSEPAGD